MDLLAKETVIHPKPGPTIRKAKSFQFIVSSSPDHASQETRKLIKSHVSRNRDRRKKNSEMKSWIQRQSGSGKAPLVEHKIPERVGWDFSLLDFPEVLQAYMREDLTHSLTTLKGALYPSEICSQVDPMQSSWTTSLLSDAAYFHSAIFSLETCRDKLLGRPQSSISQFHFLKTLRLLQERLDSPEDPVSISDATIMVVVLLGLTAEFVGDRSVAENHLAGMGNMVKMRGGLTNLRFQNSRLPAKACRVDLALALRFGCKPVFFRDEIPWDPYIAEGQVFHRKTVQHLSENEISRFVATLDTRLVNVWNDAQEFCRLGNLAQQTNHKLSPNTFSEILASILYRLLSLSFPESHIEEAIRIGLMAFASAVFFRWRGLRQRQVYLEELFRGALQNLERSRTKSHALVLFWLMMIWNTCVLDCSSSPSDPFAPWLARTIEQSGLGCWQEARAILKPTVWLDFVNDVPGEIAFTTAMATGRRATPP